MEPRNLLVVDDEPSMSVLLQVMLRARGWHVEGCASAEAALRLVATSGFDVIVVDRGLPGISGIELIAKLRERSCESAILVATGFATVDYAKELMPLGVRALLEKPFEDVALLQTVIEDAFARAREEREAKLLGSWWRVRGVAPAIVIATLCAVDRHALALLASRCGAQTFEVASGSEAATILRQLPIDACLLGGVAGDVVDSAYLVRAASPTTTVLALLDNPSLAVLKQLMVAQVRGIIDRPIMTEQATSVLSRALMWAQRVAGKPADLANSSANPS